MPLSKVTKQPVTTLVTTYGYQFGRLPNVRLPEMVATESRHFARPIKRWFPLRFPRYRSAFHWSNNVLWN